MINDILPPTESTLEEVNAALEQARAEHRQLAAEIAEGKRWQLTKEVQMKQLEDNFKHLEKEHKRIAEWDKQVAEREENVKHYVLEAETGYLHGNLQ